MCGRFYLTTSADVLAQLFGIELARVADLRGPAWGPRYNIAPSQEIAIVRVNEEVGQRELTLARWGLIPRWAKEPDIGTRTINCRAETADTKPGFRASFFGRRCLIPADGFYEWKVLGDGSKQPVLIRARASSGDTCERPFAMAGLWDRWESPDGSPVDSCTILTTEASEFVRPIHDRMPVIVRPSDHEAWLGAGETSRQDVTRLKNLCRPYPAELLTAHPVGRLVNSPRHDDPRCVQPVMAEEGLF